MEKFLKVDNNVHQGFDSTPCARVTNQSEPNYIKGQGKLIHSYNFTSAIVII